MFKPKREETYRNNKVGSNELTHLSHQRDKQDYYKGQRIILEEESVSVKVGT